MCFQYAMPLCGSTHNWKTAQRPIAVCQLVVQVRLSALAAAHKLPMRLWNEKQARNTAAKRGTPHRRCPVYQERPRSEGSPNTGQSECSRSASPSLPGNTHRGNGLPPGPPTRIAQAACSAPIASDCATHCSRRHQSVFMRFSHGAAMVPAQGASIFKRLHARLRKPKVSAVHPIHLDASASVAKPTS